MPQNNIKDFILEILKDEKKRNIYGIAIILFFLIIFIFGLFLHTLFFILGFSLGIVYNNFNKNNDNKSSEGQEQERHEE